MTLTHKERFLRAINHEQADRVPTYAFKCEAGFARAYEDRFASDRGDDGFNWTQFTQDQTILVHLGLDATTDPGLGARPDPAAKFKSFQTPEGDWVGTDGRVHRTASDGRSFYYAGYWTSKEVWEQFPKRVPPPEEEFIRFEKFYKQVVLAEDRIYVFPIIHGLHECNWLSLGYATFAKEIRRPTFYPAVIEDLHKCNVETCKRLLEIDPEMVIAFTDDIAQKERLMIAPKYFEQFYLPWYKQLFALIHKRGGRTMIHTDGKIDELVPRYIEMGLDLLQGLEPAAGVDLIALNEQYGDKIAWNGNLDVSRLLWKGTPMEVRNEAERIIKAVGPSNNLVFGPCTDIMAWHPIENIEALYSAAFAFDPSTAQFNYARDPYRAQRAN